MIISATKIVERKKIQIIKKLERLSKCANSKYSRAEVTCAWYGNRVLEYKWNENKLYFVFP